ncbi:MAG TPA: GTPase HflX [Chloroflexota bacterium]|nr:GTPase HflX [Chloroflexota bacterium]
MQPLGRRPIETRPNAPRALLVGVAVESEPSIWSVQDSLDELSQLAVSVGFEVIGAVHQRMRSAHPATFVGRGKVEQIREMATEQRGDLVIFDNELSPSQQRNLEETLKVPVIDRSQVILDVFAERARTKEGRLQVQLAAQEYMLPRLAGAWTHLSRQFGRGETRGGPGETQLELDRRRARERVADLKRQIERVREQRQVHRQNRREHGLQVASLVGYTNAGKSTLFNALVNAGVSAQNRPFDTLDPTTRRLTLPSGQAMLLSDTVGFIQKLPVTLVAAFRATLEELAEADVLVHVLDVTHPCGFEQSQEVDRTLASLGVAEKPRVTALNKVDRLHGVTAYDDVFTGEIGAMLQEMTDHYTNAVAVSAVRRWGLDRLRAAIERTLATVSK